MQIRDLTRQECIEFLTRSRVGRLACAHDGQPYITPISYAYGDGCLYSFSRSGQKISWMRANPLVCVEVDKLGGEQQWETVVVLGRYEELSETPQNHAARQRAHELLQQHPMWWEPGSVTTMLHERQTGLTYFRVHIEQVTGRNGTPDLERELPAEHAGPAQWLRRLLNRPARQHNTHPV